MDKQITIVAALIKNEAGEILLAKRHQPQSPGNSWKVGICRGRNRFRRRSHRVFKKGG